jgi:hypothetical protein
MCTLTDGALPVEECEVSVCGGVRILDDIYSLASSNLKMSVINSVMKIKRRKRRERDGKEREGRREKGINIDKNGRASSRPAVSMGGDVANSQAVRKLFYHFGIE